MKLSLRVDDGGHRQATWLELFFDLAFVICIGALSHQLIEHPDSGGLVLYLGLFVPVWWVWNQFTWYSSHFDNDDVPFRLLMLAGVGGTLFLAGALRSYSAGRSDPLVFAYLFLHVVLGIGWLRAYRNVAKYRSYIRFKLSGIALGIGLWTASRFVAAPNAFPLCALGVGLQLLMPMFAWASVKSMISVHYHHLLERHGLFTIIVLGECLLALAAHLHAVRLEQLPLVASIFLILVSIWWIYFDWGYDPINLKVVSRAFLFNYGQFLVYVSLGVVAAGTELALKGWVAGSRFLVAGTSAYLLSLSGINLFSGREGFTLRARWRLGAGLALVLILGAFRSGALSHELLVPLTALIIAAQAFGARPARRAV